MKNRCYFERCNAKVASVFESYKIKRDTLEERSFDGKYYIARSYMDVPDIDGVIFVNCDEENLEGQFAKVKILKTQDYDLIAEKI